MRTAAIALVVCLTASTLPADEPTQVFPGSSVRVRIAGGASVRGTLTRFDTDGLTIVAPNGHDSTTIGLHQLERMQVQKGRDFGAGLFRGLLVGVVAGIVVGKLTQGEGCEGNPECQLSTAVYLTLLVPAGAIVGTAASPAAWRDVPLPALPGEPKHGLGLRLNPVRDGAGLALTYGF